MKYCLLEIRKILQEHFFVIFMVLCLLLNIGLCFADSTARNVTNHISAAENNLQGEKIFNALNANTIGSFYYNEKYIESSVLNQWIKEKYENLQPAIDNLNSENADLSYFAGEYTNAVHEALFSLQIKALMLECIVLISLICVRSFSIEQQNDMVSIVYSSKRGRKLSRDKIVANGVVCALFCITLTIISLGIFFTAWDFSGLWNSNMSSSFHTVLADSNEPLNGKPFITWTSFTLKEYLLLSLVLMIGVLSAWWLISNIVALIVSKVVVSGSVLVSMIVLPFFGLLLLPGLHFARMFYLTTLTISTVVYCNQWWFTDLGSYSLFAYQEVWTILFHLIFGSIGICLGIRYFKRKELV